MRYDPRFPRACAAGRAAAPHTDEATLAAIVNAVLVETDRMLEEDADTHDIVLPAGVPACDRVPVEDVVSPAAVWSPGRREFLYVSACPRHEDEILLAYAGGFNELYGAGEDVLIACRGDEAEAWNRQRAAEAVGQFDWAADDERGVA
jgi:hypothetical protein